jgi:hypothetical protein
LTAGEAKNVDNAVVLARLFNEASGQKAPSKKHGLFISRSLKKLIKINDLMAKRRIKKSSKSKKKTDVTAADAAANKKFFTITAICVVVLLVIIFMYYKNN